MLRFCDSFLIGLVLYEAVIGLHWDIGEYRYQSYMDDYVNNTSALYNGQSPSKLECASRCEAQHPRCISFFYVQNSGTCTLHCVKFASISGLTHAPSSNYFTRGDVCPPGWTVYGTSCYLFVQNQKSYFKEAEHYCRQHQNSHLVEINTEAEHNFIRQFLRRLNGVGNSKSDEFHWFGLTDEVAEGMWVWRSNNVSPEYTDWVPGSPDSFSGNQDCGCLDPRHNYKWNDCGCSYLPYEPICELSSGCGDVVIGK